MTDCTEREIAASYLVVCLAILTLSMPAIIGLAQLKHETEALATRMELRKVAILIQESLVEAVLSSRRSSIHFSKNEYSKFRGNNLTKKQYVPSHFELRATPEKILIHPEGVVSPGTVTLQSNHNVCSLTLALRGRIRSRCHRR